MQPLPALARRAAELLGPFDIETKTLRYTVAIMIDLELTIPLNRFTVALSLPKYKWGQINATASECGELC